MPGIAIIGAQWGDEGKGKVVDVLAREADYVIRYQGGANAGHTVVAEGKVFKLNLLPSGVIHPHAVNVLGDGMVIDPFRFQEEVEGLRKEGFDPKILVSERAHLVLPHHKHVESRHNFVGTTGRGIGPAYSDRARRVGIRAGDLLDEATLRERVRRLLAEKPNSASAQRTSKGCVRWYGKPAKPLSGKARSSKISSGRSCRAAATKSPKLASWPLPMV